MHIQDPPSKTNFAQAAAKTLRGILLGMAGTSLLLGAAAHPVSAELVAERITAENFSSRQVGGPDAIAGVGDWFISNGRLCAAISDPNHMSALAPQGGVLIDLGHCDAMDDQWTVLQPILNLSLAQTANVTQILSGIDDQRAWIQTHAYSLGIEITTTYALDLVTPSALSISIDAKRVGDGDRLYSIGSVVLHPSGQTPAFSMLRSNLDRSFGFVYPSFSGTSTSSLMKALASSDLTVLVGGDEMPPISYGLEQISTTLGRLPKSQKKPDAPAALKSFSVTGQHFTLLNSLTRPLWFKGRDKPPGLLQFMQLPFMDLKSKSILRQRSRIWVGERADVASITDQIWPDSPVVHGQIDDAAARIHIDLASGAPVSEIRPNADGSFQLRLPAGQYRGRAIGMGGREQNFEFAVLENVSADLRANSIPPIRLGSPGRVRLPDPFIGRLVFLNEDGSGPAIFGDDLLGFRIGDSDIPSGLEAPFLNLAASPLDPKYILLAPGRYRVVAIRGPEYEASETRIEVGAGEEISLELSPLPRAIQTPGWITADLHVHSGISFDSNLPQWRQIIAFAASGAEVLVATEHDRIFDPTPAIEQSGLTKELASITGIEVTSAVGGDESPNQSAHLNAFPVTPREGTFRNGAPSLARQRLRDTLAEIREIAPAAFVQLNHPRPAHSVPEDDAYFSHLGAVGKPFDPTKPLTSEPNATLLELDSSHGLRDLDYHGVELLNGKSLLAYRRTRADWFSMLLQGERIVGTANSDSHRLGEIVGLPRTYVQVTGDSVASFDRDEFMQSLRAGHAFGSTGPIVSARLDDAGLGELHSGSSGVLVIAVDAADWVPVEEWRAYVNGELIDRGPISAGESVRLPLRFERDAFVTIEVEGKPEGLYRDALPGYIPFAFTNPIFVDVDGNGRFDAPGLPDSLPATLRDPDRPE